MLSRTAVVLVLSFEVVALLTSHNVNGFVLNQSAPDPCNIVPEYPSEIFGLPKDPHFTMTTEVPENCTRGFFEWHYPRGHVFVHFSNTKRLATKICFGEALGGEIFTIVHDTEGADFTLPRIDRDQTDPIVCTPVTVSKKIVLRIDAPSAWTYMGAFSYVIESKNV